MLAAGCFVLAALSLLLPWGPSFDPWGWIVWGREIAHPGMGFSTAGYPSWKPLPVAFTALFSLLGDSAPSLWLVFARAGALLALVAAYRLATQLGGRLAGALSVLALVLVPGWLRYFSDGVSEPLLVALVLWAVDRHMAGRRSLALTLAFFAALLRPEVWPFLLGYALLYAGRDRRRWLVAIPLLLAVPVLWFVPEWIGAGDPFHGTNLARTSHEAEQTRTRGQPALDVARGGLKLVLAPLWLAAVVATVASAREAYRRPFLLAMATLAWMGLVVAMTALGYAGIPRFMLPAAAMACVLGATGVSHLAGHSGLVRPILVSALFVLACVPFALPRVLGLQRQAVTAKSRNKVQAQLEGAFTRLGGPKAVRARGALIVDNAFRTPAAWTLKVPQAQLGSPSGAELAFIRRGRGQKGIEAALRRVGVPPHSHHLLRVGSWEVRRFSHR